MCKSRKKEYVNAKNDEFGFTYSRVDVAGLALGQVILQSYFG
jgi:hypothetical protein